MREMRSKGISRLFLLALLCLASSPAVFAQQKTSGTPDKYTEGVHFDRVEVPQQTMYQDKVEVLEFFTYGCPHCYRLYPLIQAWKKRQKEDVVFRKIPLYRGGQVQNINIVQAHYVAALTGMHDLHNVIFEWHQGRRVRRDRTRYLTNKELVKIFGRRGMDEKTFRKLLTSFGIHASIKRGDALAINYAVRGVPVMIVHGKYKVFPRKDLPFPAMLRVVDYLVERERREMNPVLDEPAEAGGREGGA